MNTYTIQRGVKLRTSATRRYLIVSVMDGRAKVEAATNDQDGTARLFRHYQGLFAHNGDRCTLHLLDQTGRWD